MSVDERDRRALERLIADQAYRERLASERANFWNRAAVVAALLGSILVVAAAVAQLVHLL